MFVNSIDLQVTSTLDFVLLKSDVTSTTPTEVPGVLPVIVSSINSLSLLFHFLILNPLLFLHPWRTPALHLKLRR